MKRTLAAFLAVFWLLTQVVFAHAAEINFLNERRRFDPAFLPQPVRILPTLSSTAIPARLKSAIPKQLQSVLFPLIKALPQNAGTIRKITCPEKSRRVDNNSGRIVIHIQDIHRNLESQTNIGQAVQSLITKQAVGLVAVEGAFGPMDFSWYRRYPYQDSVKAVADYLFREKRIAGPVYVAFTLRLRSGQALPPFVGIDHKEHYDANVKAYQAAAPLADFCKKVLEKKRLKLAHAKSVAFNVPLKDFDDHVEAYRHGSLSWEQYVRLLEKTADVFSPHMEAYLAAVEMERALDFNQVELERTALVAQLTKKLSAAETDDLLKQSAAYRAGGIAHTDFYSYLKKLCSSHGVRVNNFPAMDAYVRYVLLSDALNVGEILQEIASTEKDAYQALIKTEQERRLVQESRLMFLEGKLLDFALTKEEWEEYKNSKSQVSISKLEAPFENFYKEAEARDDAMAANLEKAMDSSQSKVAVLVTGGFHSDGMDRQLQSHGMTIISYVPRINKIDDNGSAYLSVFAQEKTPLDKLFAGEKLFLADLALPAEEFGENSTVLYHQIKSDPSGAQSGSLHVNADCDLQEQLSRDRPPAILKITTPLRFRGHIQNSIRSLKVFRDRALTVTIITFCVTIIMLSVLKKLFLGNGDSRMTQQADASLTRTHWLTLRRIFFIGLASFSAYLLTFVGINLIAVPWLAVVPVLAIGIYIANDGLAGTAGSIVATFLEIRETGQETEWWEISKTLRRVIVRRALLSLVLPLFYYGVVVYWWLPPIAQFSEVAGIGFNVVMLAWVARLDHYWKLRFMESEHNPDRIEARAETELPTYVFPVVILFTALTVFSNKMALAIVGSLVVYGIGDFAFNVFIFPLLGKRKAAPSLVYRWIGWWYKKPIVPTSVQAMIAVFLDVARVSYLFFPSLLFSVIAGLLVVRFWTAVDPHFPSAKTLGEQITRAPTKREAREQEINELFGLISSEPQDASLRSADFRKNVKRLAKLLRKHLGVKKDLKSSGIELEFKFKIDKAQWRELSRRLRKIPEVKISNPETVYQYLDTPTLDLLENGFKVSLAHKRNGKAIDQLAIKGNGIDVRADPLAGLTVRWEKTKILKTGGKKKFSGGAVKPLLEKSGKEAMKLMVKNLGADIVERIDRTQIVVTTQKTKFKLPLGSRAHIEFSLDRILAAGFKGNDKILSFPIDREATSQVSALEFEIELAEEPPTDKNEDPLENQLEHLAELKFWSDTLTQHMGTVGFPLSATLVDKYNRMINLQRDIHAEANRAAVIAHELGERDSKKRIILVAVLAVLTAVTVIALGRYRLLTPASFSYIWFATILSFAKLAALLVLIVFDVGIVCCFFNAVGFRSSGLADRTESEIERLPKLRELVGRISLTQVRLICAAVVLAAGLFPYGLFFLGHSRAVLSTLSGGLTIWWLCILWIKNFSISSAEPINFSRERYAQPVRKNPVKAEGAVPRAAAEQELKAALLREMEKTDSWGNAVRHSIETALREVGAAVRTLLRPSVPAGSDLVQKIRVIDATSHLLLVWFNLLILVVGTGLCVGVPDIFWGGTGFWSSWDFIGVALIATSAAYFVYSNATDAHGINEEWTIMRETVSDWRASLGVLKKRLIHFDQPVDEDKDADPDLEPESLPPIVWLVVSDIDGTLTKDAQPIGRKMIRLWKRLAKIPDIDLAFISGMNVDGIKARVTGHLPKSVQALVHAYGEMGGQKSSPGKSDELTVLKPLSELGKNEDLLEPALIEVLKECEREKLFGDFKFKQKRVEKREAKASVWLYGEDKRGEAVRLPLVIRREVAKKIKQKLAEKGLGSLHVLVSSIAIDVSLVDKADALIDMAAYVARKRGVSDATVALKHTLAIGDSENDFAMLRRVADAGGVAVWVGDPDELDPGDHFDVMSDQGPKGTRAAIKKHFGWAPSVLIFLSLLFIGAHGPSYVIGAFLLICLIVLFANPHKFAEDASAKKASVESVSEGEENVDAILRDMNVNVLFSENFGAAHFMRAVLRMSNIKTIADLMKDLERKFESQIYRRVSLISFRRFMQRIQATDDVWKTLGTYQSLITSEQWYARLRKIASTAHQDSEVSAPKNLNEISLKDFTRIDRRLPLKEMGILTAHDLVANGWRAVFDFYCRRYNKRQDALKNILTLAKILRSHSPAWSLMTQEQKDAWDSGNIENSLVEIKQIDEKTSPPSFISSEVKKLINLESKKRKRFPLPCLAFFLVMPGWPAPMFPMGTFGDIVAVLILFAFLAHYLEKRFPDFFDVLSAPHAPPHSFSIQQRRNLSSNWIQSDSGLEIPIIRWGVDNPWGRRGDGSKPARSSGFPRHPVNSIIDIRRQRIYSIQT